MEQDNQDYQVQDVEQAPYEFYCPITHMMMNEPVVAPDGFTYEREAIELWMQLNNTSPQTRQRFPHRWVTINWNIKKLIQAYHQKYPHLLDQRNVSASLKYILALREQQIDEKVRLNQQEKKKIKHRLRRISNFANIPRNPFSDQKSVFKAQKLEFGSKFCYLDGVLVGLYKGFLINGKRQRHGLFKFCNGDQYLGQFKNDKIDGRGRMIWKNGNQYNGQFKNNMFHGKGIFKYKNGRQEKCAFIQGIELKQCV